MAESPRDRTRADRLLVILSDIELGAGGVLDDCPDSDFIGELILGYNRGSSAALPVDLVLNGDTFDLLKTSLDGSFPRHISEPVALAKFALVADAHPDFFEALGAFLAHEEAPRRVHFVVGNHDLELQFTGVQREILRRVGGRGEIRFPGFEMAIGDVHIEHGAQEDPMFAVDLSRPFVRHKGEVILDLPWGNVALLDVALPMQAELYPLDRIKPRRQIFELLPETRDLIMGIYWRYWTRDYWKGFRRGHKDPVRRMSWTMVKELAYRFGSRDPDLTESASAYARQLRENDRFRIICAGHLHQPALWSYGDRKVLRTGCLRHEYAVDRTGRLDGPLPKSYAEVYLRGDRAARSQIVEIEGPPAPEGHVPYSLFDLLPKITPHLGSEQERERVAADVQAQEAKEAKETPR